MMYMYIHVCTAVPKFKVGSCKVIFTLLRTSNKFNKLQYCIRRNARRGRIALRKRSQRRRKKAARATSYVLWSSTVVRASKTAENAFSRDRSTSCFQYKADLYYRARVTNLALQLLAIAVHVLSWLGSVARRFFFAPLLFSLGLAAAAPRAARRQRSAKPAASRQRIESKCRYTGLQFHFSSDFSYSAKLYLTDVHRCELGLFGLHSLFSAFARSSFRCLNNVNAATITVTATAAASQRMHPIGLGFQTQPYSYQLQPCTSFLGWVLQLGVFFFHHCFSASSGSSSGWNAQDEYNVKTSSQEEDS